MNTQKKKLKEKYRKDYWEGVKKGTVRRGVKFKTIVTSAPAEPLTYAIVYEDEPGYAKAEFKLPNEPIASTMDEQLTIEPELISFTLSQDDAQMLLSTLEYAQEIATSTSSGEPPVYDPIAALIYALKNKLEHKHSVVVT